MFIFCSNYDSNSGRRSYGGSEESRRSYSGHNGSNDRRNDDSYQVGDRRGGGRGYSGGQYREDSSSKYGGRDEDAPRDYPRYGHSGDYSDRSSYPTHVEPHQESPFRSNSSYNSSYDRDSRPSSYDRSRSSYGSQDRKYERSSSYSQGRSDDSAQRPYYPTQGENSAPGPRREFTQSTSSMRSSDASIRPEESGIPAEMYMPAPAQHGDSLRSSDSFAGPELSRSTSSYRQNGGSSVGYKSFQSSIQSIGRYHELHDSQGLSISRAPTQPLEGYSSYGSSLATSTSLTSSSSVPPPTTPGVSTDNLTNTLVSIWKSLLSDVSGLDPEDQVTFKSAVESSISHLQYAQTSAAESIKASTNAVSNFAAIESAELAQHKSYQEFLAANYQKRLIEGDLNECIRTIQGLDAQDGEWPEPAWTLPPFLGMEGAGGSSSSFDMAVDAQANV